MVNWFIYLDSRDITFTGEGDESDPICLSSSPVPPPPADESSSQQKTSNGGSTSPKQSSPQSRPTTFLEMPGADQQTLKVAKRKICSVEIIESSDEEEPAKPTPISPSPAKMNKEVFNMFPLNSHLLQLFSTQLNILKISLLLSTHNLWFNHITIIKEGPCQNCDFWLCRFPTSHHLNGKRPELRSWTWPWPSFDYN